MKNKQVCTTDTLRDQHSVDIMQHSCGDLISEAVKCLMNSCWLLLMCMMNSKEDLEDFCVLMQQSRVQLCHVIQLKNKCIELEQCLLWEKGAICCSKLWPFYLSDLFTCTRTNSTLKESPYRLGKHVHDTSSNCSYYYCKLLLLCLYYRGIVALYFSVQNQGQAVVSRCTENAIHIRYIHWSVRQIVRKQENVKSWFIQIEKNTHREFYIRTQVFRLSFSSSIEVE